ncbi:MAG: ABC transporter substrate-binding protein [Rhodovibrionaceae bacterium]
MTFPAIARRQRDPEASQWILRVAASVLVLCGIVLIAASQRPALSANDPAAFLDSYGDRAVSLLGDQSRSESERREDFGQLLREGFDLESISAFVLSTYWREASEDQRSRFVEAFQGVLASRFLPLFEEAKSDSFAIRGSRNISGRDDLFMVETVLTDSKGRQVRTDWRVKKTGSGYQILDVSVEGASMAQTFRDEYRAFVRRSDQGLDGLIQRLEQQAAG